MKKLFAVSLAALLLVSAFAFGALAEETEKSLLPGADAGWHCDPCGSDGIMEVTEENGAVLFTNTQPAGWPYADIIFAEPVTANIETDALVFDFDASVQTNITFLLPGDAEFPLSCTAFKFDTYEKESGDIQTGTYKGKIALKDLVEAQSNYGKNSFPTSAIDGDTVTFTGLKVFSSGANSVTTVRRLGIIVSDSGSDPVESEDPVESSDPVESVDPVESSEPEPVESSEPAAESDPAAESAAESAAPSEPSDNSGSGLPVGAIIGIIAGVIVIICAVVFILKKKK